MNKVNFYDWPEFSKCGRGLHNCTLSTSFLAYQSRRHLAAVASVVNLPANVHRTNQRSRILSVAHRNFSDGEKAKIDFVVPPPNLTQKSSSIPRPPFSDKCSLAAQNGDISAHDIRTAKPSANPPSSDKTSISYQQIYDVPPLDLSQLNTSIPLPPDLLINTSAMNNGSNPACIMKHSVSSIDEIPASSSDGHITPLSLTTSISSTPPSPNLNNHTSATNGNNSGSSPSPDLPVTGHETVTNSNMKRLKRKNAASHRDQLHTDIAALHKTMNVSSLGPIEQGMIQTELDRFLHQRKQLGHTSPSEKSTISDKESQSQNSNKKQFNGSSFFNNEDDAPSVANDADPIVKYKLRSEHDSTDGSTPANKIFKTGKKRRRQRKHANLLKLRNKSNNSFDHERVKSLDVNIDVAKRKLRREKLDQFKRSHMNKLLSSLLQKREKIVNTASKKKVDGVKGRLSESEFENMSRIIHQSSGDQLAKSRRLQKIDNNIDGLMKALKSETLDQSKRDIMEGDLVKLLEKRKSIIFLRSLLHSHLESKGGEAWSRDIGIHLNKNLSSTGDQSALSELKEVSDSLLKFLASEHDIFTLLEENEERGRLVQLRNFEESNHYKNRQNYLRSLIHQYLMSKGGEAWSRDIGRHLNKKIASTGDQSALSELKKVHDSLTTFLASESNIFSLTEEKGEGGQLVRLRNMENPNQIADLRSIIESYLLSKGGEAWLGDISQHLVKSLPSTCTQSKPLELNKLSDHVLNFLGSESNLFSLLEGDNETGPIVRLKKEIIHLQSLIHSYLTSMGGAASTRDIGNHLIAQPSSTGLASALSDLKGVSESVLDFCRRSNLFVVSEDGDKSRGRIVQLSAYESLSNQNENQQNLIRQSQSSANISSIVNLNDYTFRPSVLEDTGGNIQDLKSGLLSLPNFNSDLISTQANGTAIGFSGSTSVISTVVFSHERPASSGNMQMRATGNLTVEEMRIKFEKSLKNIVENANARSGSAFIPLQVEYRERYHGSGKIPSHNRIRRDNSGPMTEKETLAARAVDRVLRPWLMMGLAASSFHQALPENIVVACQVQSYDPYSKKELESLSEPRHADPTALSINSAIAAIYNSRNESSATIPVPSEAAACVKLAVGRDGTIIFDPTPQEVATSKFDILYAGTKGRVLMIEFGSRGCLPSSGAISNTENEDPGVAEITVTNALRAAHDAVVSIVEHMEKMLLPNTDGSKQLNDREDLMTNEQVAKYLGLREVGAEVSQSDPGVHDANISSGNESIQKAIDDAFSYSWSKLEIPALKLFGYCDDLEIQSRDEANVYQGRLLPKRTRGRMENVLQAEVGRILEEEFSSDSGDLAEFFRSSTSGNVGRTDLINYIHELIMKRALAKSAERQFRSDGRRGLNTIRPISLKAPFLPDCVHGSAIFSRGETQVLCTATLGNPRESAPFTDPYRDYLLEEQANTQENEVDETSKYPIGSLRFLRSQIAMESDLNSRKVKAGRELIGDAGTLGEAKRFFLHYDFPDSSTGVIKSRSGALTNRRAIGHGALAEKSILPALPHPNDFPYVIRVTSEVLSSNGSSSMASACGATLALLDAGVPLIAPVAGVSVGLCPGSKQLMLDITGTEDHYGDMDFKVCGTYNGITAMQLDVKRPLSLDVIIDALDIAKEGRRCILNEMERLNGLSHRPSMKSSAPRVEVIKFDPNRKRDLVGPGGAVLRQLEERFDINIDLSQEGTCLIFGPPKSVKKAKSVIMDLVADVEEGGVYEGTVIELKDFGAIIELLRNKEGLLHVSEICPDNSQKHPEGNMGMVREHLKVGDKIEVLCTQIDRVEGSIKLSRKKLLELREKNQYYHKH